MYGFSGSNIEPWLQYFSKNTDRYEVTYLCRNFELHGMSRDRFAGVKVFQLNPNAAAPSIIRRIVSWIRTFRILLSVKRYDLFILQGLYDPQLSLRLMRSIRATRKVVQIWNISSHRRTELEPDLKSSRIIRSILSAADNILFSWEPNRLDFASRFPEFEKKTKSLVWGLPDQYFDLSYTPANEMVDDLLGDIADDDLLIFWPRSIQKNNRHDVLMESLFLLKARLNSQTWKRLKVILLGGSGGGLRVDKIREMAARLNMPGLRLVTDEYIEKKYLMRLYDRSDIFINLADSDQITLGIIEALGRRTAVILSDIPSYRYLTNFGIEVQYMINEPGAVADCLEATIKKLKDGGLNSQLDRNRVSALRSFDLNSAFSAMMEYLFHSCETVSELNEDS